ncbi:MAG: hypothetical protein P1U56_17545 [Saprospiraceae bacterium]|nr:hypothetical protein [Saprospiraceae bacterium]
MRTLLCIASILFFSTVAHAQCNTVTISNQSEMDNFSCDSVYRLTITNQDTLDPIVDFSNLGFVKFVDYEVRFMDFVFHKDTVVFSKLSSVSEISIVCDSLDFLSFPFVDSLTRITLSGNFSSFSIPSLQWVQGTMT